MGYPGKELSIPQLLFALNTKLSEEVRPFERNIPEAELSVYKNEIKLALLAVNRGLNAHQPISRLPADILLSIPSYFDSSVIQFDLLRLTHVYQYWRETFISAPSLWSTMHVGALHTPLLTLSLNRSRSVPVRLNIGPHDYHRFATVVTPAMATRRNEYDALWLDLEWEKVVAVSRLTSGAVSNLRILSLNVGVANRHLVVPTTSLLFPRASALQELSLRLVSHDISTILGCFRFTNLTVLSLFSTAPITATKVLEFLRISPGLKRIGLILRRLIADETPCRPIFLQDLRQLRFDVTASGDSHVQLFTKLICPAAEDVVVSVQPVYFGSLEASPFHPSWGFFPRSSQLHTVGLQVGKSAIETTYSVRLLYGGGSKFEISFRFVSFGVRGTPSPATHDPHGFSLFPALLRSLRAFSPSGITRLSITGIDPSTIPPSNQSEVFSSIYELLMDAENLETLITSSGCLPAVCQALAPRPTSPVVLCPNLSSVQLQLPEGQAPENSSRELATMCKARAAAGYAVRNSSFVFFKHPETPVDQRFHRLRGLLSAKST